jgi:ABC-2 type transport system ATP-binding protein
MAVALKVEDLHKSFRLGFIPKTKKILKGISLSVEEGEIFGYLGPNGAGKTTTIKCVLGLVRPEKGNIEIFGLQPLSLQAKEKIGYLPENPYFYDYLTAAEFLDFCSQLFLMGKKERAERVKELLQLVGLENALDLQLRKFSRGMLQRVGLAQALLNSPSLVILDEPLGGLDPLGRKEVRDIIVRLKKEGKTVFLSSHILQDIEMVCDRVAIIVSGEIVSQGALHELVSEKIYFIEVILSGIEESKLKGLAESFSVKGGRIMLRVLKEENLEKILELVRSQKGKIHSLTPRTETLEDIFVEAVKQK